MRSVLVLLLLSLSLFASAQQRRLEKAHRFYESERYEKANKLLEKVLKHKETRNDAEALLLQAKVLTALRESPDFPKALPDALKYAEKAIRKNKSDQDLMVRDSVFFGELRDLCLEAAEVDLREGRYIQADKYYTKLYELYGFLPAKWGTARVALALKDTATALKISREIVGEVFDSSEKKLFRPNVAETPFVLLVEHYIDRRNFDTASYFAERSADLYPESALLKSLLLKSFLLYVTGERPTLQTTQLFAHLRPRFENDSLFLHKENVLFLYLINLYASDEEKRNLSDSLLAGLIQIKSDYYAAHGDDYLRKDPIYSPDHNEFIFNLIRYTARFERHNMLAMLLNNYVSGTYADSAYRTKKRPERWKALFDRTVEENSVFLLSASLEVASDELKKESWFAPLKRKLLTDVFRNPGSYTDRAALYNFIPFMLETYPRDRGIYESTKELSKSIIAEYTDSSWFSYAKLAISQHDLYYEQDQEMKALKKNFTVRDFIANYYGSRLLRDSVNGRLVPEYVWGGNTLLCDEGRVPETVQQKVEQRINYFRRTAGVPDYVRLDTLKNKACQKAALIYQVNTGKMFTEPAETWKCFSLSAVDAAQLSARVFGQTTVFAVTTIMADQGEENTFVGNRRWLLYPPARSMGHGSTDKVAMIWTLDNSGNKDTTAYMQDFVSWPPRDFCPTMFAFSRWSFSLYADLSKARVSMKANGKSVPVKQENLVAGYGMPTLVWAPQFEAQEGVVYTVVISGVKIYGEKSPITYSYQVEFVNPMKEQ